MRKCILSGHAHLDSFAMSILQDGQLSINFFIVNVGCTITFNRTPYQHHKNSSVREARPIRTVPIATV